MADRHIRTAKLELEAGKAGGGVADGAVEQQRRRGDRAAAEERLQILARRLPSSGARPEHHTGLVVAPGRVRVPGVAHGLAGDHDGEHTGGIHSAQLHRWDPLRRLEAGDRRREARVAIVGRERGHRGRCRSIRGGVRP